MAIRPLAVALSRARAALKKDRFFETLPIEAQALEIYIELRGKLGRQPTDGEVKRRLAGVLGLRHRNDRDAIDRTQWRRVCRVLARVRGH